MAKQALVYDTVTGKNEGVGGTTNQVLTRNSSSEWAAADQPYDTSGEYPGAIPTGSYEIAHFIAVRPFTIKADSVNTRSQAYCGTTEAASRTFTITKYASGGGTTTVGTFNFPVSTPTATFTIGSDVSFAAGDRFIITGPAVTAGIGMVYWTLFSVLS